MMYAGIALTMTTPVAMSKIVVMMIASLVVVLSTS